jgi:hypothetical protein
MLKHLGSCLSPLPALICCSLSVSLGILAVLLTFDSPESTRKRLPVEVTLSLRGSKLVNYARATTCDFKFHCVRACCIAGFTKPVAGQLVFIANQKTMVPWKAVVKLKKRNLGKFITKICKTITDESILCICWATIGVAHSPLHWVDCPPWPVFDPIHAPRPSPTSVLPSRSPHDPSSILWHPGSRLNRIDRIVISLRYIFFFGSPPAKNSGVKCVWPGAISGWVTDREVFPDAQSEDKSA